MSKTITVSGETYELVKEQLKREEKIDISSLEDMVGKCFFFRTVTYHLTGRVAKVIGKIVMLEDAAWVASSGPFSQAIRTGVLNEVEPVDEAFVNLDATTDFFPWVHDLPRERK